MRITMKKRILWQTAINEIEYDIQQMFAGLPGYTLSLSEPSARNSYFFPVDVKIDYFNTVSEEAITAAIEEFKPHIMVHRYRQPIEPLLAACKKTNTRLLTWITEQGPEREVEVDRAQCFHNVIANNDSDYDFYKAHGVENVYNMPFGCVPSFHRKVRAQAKYKTDVVCYGNPLYTYYESKRKAVDTLVKPVVENGFDVALWGTAKGGGGWLEIPYVKNKPHLYRGMFPYEDLPAVNAGAKIVLGITANAQYGAYGSRLARALGCGSFIIWHYTEGMEKYLENHKHLCWSTSPKETLELVKYYLKHDKEREKIAKEGQRYAYDHLNYETMLLPIIQDVLDQPEVRNSSAWYDRCIPAKDAYRAGDYKETLDKVEPILAGAGSQRIKDELIFYKANSHYFLGQYERCADLLGGLLKRRQQPEWLNNMGVVQYKLRNATAGERSLEQALEIKPGYLDARFNLEFARLNAPAFIDLKLTKGYIRS
jgi:spore maturation protein CgeB